MNTIEKTKQLYNKLIGPILNILVSLALMGVFIYFLIGGSFNISDIADQNNTVHIPVVLLIVFLPVGYLIDLVGPALGISIIILVLIIWLALSIKTFLKRLHQLKVDK